MYVIRKSSCLLGNFAGSFLVCRFFFRNQLLRNLISRIPSDCQTVWIQIRPDVLSGQIWVQTVCKDYQLTTPVHVDRVLRDLKGTLELHIEPMCLACLFELILYVPSTIFQLLRGGSSWIEPAVS